VKLVYDFVIAFLDYHSIWSGKAKVNGKGLMVSKRSIAISQGLDPEAQNMFVTEFLKKEEDEKDKENGGMYKKKRSTSTIGGQGYNNDAVLADSIIKELNYEENLNQQYPLNNGEGVKMDYTDITDDDINNQ